MTEKPILFSGAMVRAILEGQKTQTRRIISGVETRQPSTGEPFDTWKGFALSSGDRPGYHSPYGVPGGCLWVRETWRCFGGREYEHQQIKENIIYRATADSDEGEWRPSIFMPRWASRLLLEITNVRVERVQDITEADCWAEGISDLDGQFDDKSLVRRAKAMGCCVEDGRPCFAELWDQINGKRATWESNPWVWVVEFKKL